MTSHSPEQERQARDPQTPPQILEALAARYPALRPAIAANPSASAATRAKILATTRPPSGPVPPRIQAPTSPPAAQPDEVPTVVFRHGDGIMPPPTQPQPTVPPDAGSPPRPPQSLAGPLPPPRPVASPEEPVVVSVAGPGTRTDKDRRTMAVLLGAAVFVVVAGILGALFMLFSQHAPQVVSSSLAEQQAASNSAEPSPTASPSVSPSPAPTADTVVSLNQLGASGCSAATKDAQLLVDYGKQNSNGPNWKTNDAEAKVVQAMEVLKQKCKGDYAKQVADTAKASGATEALSTTLDEVAGASLAIVSPSGNITCVLSANGVTCNVKDRIYPADQDCAGAEFFTVAVDKTGAVNSCGAAAQSSGGAQRLEYGQSKSEGEFTCTSESSGMTCKHTPTGKGFKVAKEAWSQS